MDKESMPASPFSAIGAAAIELHQAYTDILAAGFSREEAMQILLVVLNNQLKGC